MAKEKVTLTLDTEQMAELRSLVDARSLSATVDEAVAAHLEHLRHVHAVRLWLAELDAEFGPVDAESAQWAASTVQQWQLSLRSDAEAG